MLASRARLLILCGVITATWLVAPLASSAEARTRHYWVAAVPTMWNAVPSGRDPISGETYEPSETIFDTVVYRRFTHDWGRVRRNAPRSVSGHNLIPGPFIRARAGDRIRVHFKNLDPEDPHSMHFHGVHYRPESDGSYIPGFSGPGGSVEPGKRFTYRLRAGRDSVGVWPYHDHSPSMMESIAGGMYGAISILGRRERRPDREFVVFFESMGDFMTINGRAFLGNTPIFRARTGHLVQWDVLALGDDFHTFHPHGHRWVNPDGTPEDTRTIGPAESFRVRWREKPPGTWLYHCHVESHMDRGMIGLYRVRR